MNSDYINLGKQLQLARKKANVNQTQAGKILGIAQSTYAFYEMGKRKMPLNLIKKFAESFNVSMDTLLGSTPQSTHISQLQQKYNQLDEKGKHTVDTVLRMEFERCEAVAAHSDNESSIDLIRQDIEDIKKGK